MGMVYRRCGRHPTIAVHVIVVGTRIDHGVGDPHIVAICRHSPNDVGSINLAAETQIFGSIEHAVAMLQPYTVEVEGHKNLFARIGVITIDPQLVILTVYTLVPHLIEQHVGLQFVFVAAVNHHLVLRVEVLRHADCLRISKIVHRPCRSSHSGKHKHDGKDETFHRFIFFLF